MKTRRFGTVFLLTASVALGATRVNPALAATLLTFKQALAMGLTAHTYPRLNNRLVTATGERLFAYDIGNGYRLYRMEATGLVAAKDGVYTLESGGRLIVSKGIITSSDTLVGKQFPNPGYAGGPIGFG